jgi:O-antigen/teichoic acid export membrane protein
MNIGFLVVLIAGATYIYLSQSPLTTLVILLGASSLVATVVGLRTLDLKGIIITPFSKRSFMNIINYGKHGILRELTGTISTRIGLFITASLLSLTQTAFLGVAQRYLTLLLIPNSAFQSLLYPVLVRISKLNDPAAMKETFEFQVSKLLAAMIVLALGISILSPWIILVLHGEEYQPAIGLLIISIWTLAIFSPFGSAFGSIINTIGKPKLNSVIVMVNSIINIVLAYLLILWLGLYGAVLAPLITELFGFLWARKIVRTNTNIDYNNIFSMIPQHYKSVYIKLKTSLAS